MAENQRLKLGSASAGDSVDISSQSRYNQSSVYFDYAQRNLEVYRNIQNLASKGAPRASDSSVLTENVELKVQMRTAQADKIAAEKEVAKVLLKFILPKLVSITTLAAIFEDQMIPLCFPPIMHILLNSIDHNKYIC